MEADRGEVNERQREGPGVGVDCRGDNGTEGEGMGLEGIRDELNGIGENLGIERLLKKWGKW